VTEQRATVRHATLTPVRYATFIVNEHEGHRPAKPVFQHADGYTTRPGCLRPRNPIRLSSGARITTNDHRPLLHAISQRWYAPGDLQRAAFPRSLAQRIGQANLTQNFCCNAAGDLDYQTTTGDLKGNGKADTATTDYTFNALNLPTLIIDPMSNRTAIFYEDPARTGCPPGLRAAQQAPSSARPSMFIPMLFPVENRRWVCFKGRRLRKVPRMQPPPNEAYDNRGFPLTMTRFTGTLDPNVVTTYVSMGEAREIERKDAAGRKVVSAYDDMGRRTWEEYWEASGRIGWNYRYFNGNGEVEWTDGPRYAPEDYVWRKYDGAGAPSEELIWRSASNGSGTGVAAGLPESGLYTNSFFVHNLFGDLTEIHNPLGNTTIMGYDGIGQLLTRTFYEGTSTFKAQESFTREPGGLPATYTNPLRG